MTIQYSVGDEVEATFHGKVTRVKDSSLYNGQRIDVYDGRTTHALYPTFTQHQVKMVKPAVEEGCVYMDATGKLYYRLRQEEMRQYSDTWREISTGLTVRDSYPVKPFKSLVPEK